MPSTGYLETVREICRRTGTVLIFDEVITGFRVARGGVQERLALHPTLPSSAKPSPMAFLWPAWPAPPR
jgi:glutamate-1-semialdehyde 2,1-aminomutase